MYSIEETFQANSPYFSVSHVTSSVYVDSLRDGRRGRVLLFVFFVAKTKEQSTIDETAQNTIRIVIDSPIEKSIFLGMNDFEYVTWGLNFFELATKGNFYLSAKILPENFWDLDDIFKQRFYDRTVSAALSDISDIEKKSTNILELDVALEYAHSVDYKGKKVVDFIMVEDFDRVRGYSYQIPTTEKKSKKSPPENIG